MNFCRRCESDYDQPGTCNCYAAVKPFLTPDDKPWYPGLTPGWINPVYPEIPVNPHDTTVAPQPSPWGTTCVYFNNETRTVSVGTVVSSGSLAYDPSIPFTYTNENSFEPVN